MHTLIQKVLQTVQQNALLCAGDTVYVALSGGADSVTLLQVLLSLSDTLGLGGLQALHVHHGLRGEFADRDEQFVRELCRTLDVPLTVARVDTKAEVARTGESVEEAGRRLRYTFFKEQAGDDPRAKIATAHTADDQAETILLHLIRGSGTKGVAGIPIRREQIIRPLLDCTAGEVRSFCAECGYDYVIDETNTDLCYARNRVRHTILPAMRLINKQADRSLIRFAQIMAKEDRFLSAQASRIVKEALNDNGSLRISVLLQADDVLQRRVLLQVIDHAEHAHIEALLRILKDGGCVNLPGDISALSDGQTLSFVKRSRFASAPSQECHPLNIGAEVSIGDAFFCPTLLSYKEYCEKSKIHKNLFNFCVSYDMIKDDLVLRTRRAGDTIRPFRRNCTKTLKKLLNELQIPCENRMVLPVLADSHRVLSLPGICVDESVAVTSAAKQILWLQKL